MALTIATNVSVACISTNTTWSLVTADGTTGATPLELPGAADKTVQVSNIGATGAVVAIEGSLDKVTYFALHDPQGNALSFSADGLKAILENCNFVRPRLSTVGTAATVAVNILSRYTQN